MERRHPLVVFNSSIHWFVKCNTFLKHNNLNDNQEKLILYIVNRFGQDIVYVLLIQKEKLLDIVKTSKNQILNTM